MLVEEAWRYELTQLDHQVFRQVVRPNHPLATASECISCSQVGHAVHDGMWDGLRATLRLLRSPWPRMFRIFDSGTRSMPYVYSGSINCDVAAKRVERPGHGNA